MLSSARQVGRGPDFITSSENPSRFTTAGGWLVIRRYFRFGGNVLRRVRILQHVGFEVVVGKGVDDDVAFGRAECRHERAPL